mgnify:CR=1 FL=1
MTIDYIWVKGRYKGDNARYIKGLIDNGIGYFQLEHGTEGRQTFIDVAFPMVLDEDGLPDHLVEITNPYQVEKLEKKRHRRIVSSGRKLNTKNSKTESVKQTLEKLNLNVG